MKNFIFIALVSLFSFEVLSRFPLAFWGFEVFPRFEYRVQGGQVEEIINSRGAVGYDYQGQPMQVAVFGTSTARHPDDSMNSWPLMLQRLHPDKIHVDNFSITGLVQDFIYKKFEELEKSKQFYDWIIIQGDLTRTREKNGHSPNVYFTRWENENQHLVSLPQYFKKWWERKMQNGEPRIFSLFRSPSVESEQDFSKIIHDLQGGAFVTDYKVRQSSLIKGFLADVKILPDARRVNKTKENIYWLFEKARKISKNQAWVPLLSAYHPNMRRSYLKKYKFLDPIKAFDNKKIHSPASFYSFRNERMKIIKKTVKDSGLSIQIIDYYTELNHLITLVDDLYIDEMHHSLDGNKRIAKFVGQRIYPGIFKNQNK